MLSLFVLAAACRLVGASVLDNGTVLTVNGIPYYAGGAPLGRLDGTDGMAAGNGHGLALIPMNIIETSKATFQGSDLSGIVASYQDTDDVFQPAFLQSIYIRSTTAWQPVVNVSSLASTLVGFNTSFLMAAGNIHGQATGVKLSVGTIDGNLPKGPYFISASSGNIFKAHRLYGDDNLAFIQGVISDENDGFLSLSAVTENVMAKSIAVPSRLYYDATEAQPLAGLRLGVKDIYHVKGVATSGGNRAYFYLYGAQNTTAPSVQRLIDLGAVLVGKMGTVQFANGDRPTADWVDLHAPFNPRADGYQDPSGSSTGPGAGIASYDWLDIAVGSDTGGSMRGPAGAQGIYGNRPSTGAISMDNVIPLSPVSDSAGIFTRSGKLWATVTQAWYQNTTAEWMYTNSTSYPPILYRSLEASDWTAAPITPAAATVIDGWVSKLEQFLNINSTITNLTAQWEETRGDAPASLQDMLYLTYGVFVSHDQWNLLGKQFFADYAAVNGGRQPFINPGPLARWRWSQENATDEVYAQGLQNITTFKNWYETAGFGRHDPESCSEGLYIYPFFIGEPSYRNSYRFSAPTRPPLGFGDSSVSVMAGVPEVVVPIGEVSYNSTVSMQTEYLPITMALRMARGCDHALATLVGDLETAGVLQPVLTGRRLYE